MNYIWEKIEREDKKKEPTYLKEDDMNEESRNLEDLLSSTAFGSKLNDQIQNYMNKGMSEADILNRLTENMKSGILDPSDKKSYDDSHQLNMQKKDFLKEKAYLCENMHVMKEDFC